MATVDREPIEQTIHTVAVRRLGVADTSIVRTNTWGFLSKAREAWYALAVRLPGDTEWKPLGRRRTKSELLLLVETIDPRHIDGVRF